MIIYELWQGSISNGAERDDTELKHYELICDSTNWEKTDELKGLASLFDYFLDELNSENLDINDTWYQLVTRESEAS